jgi:Subtilase family
VPERRALGYTGAGVTVAVLDTGIDDHDPAVAGAVVAEHCFVPPDGCLDGTGEQDGPGSAQDDQGHGTAMTDIIAGNGRTGPVGVAPGASIVVDGDVQGVRRGRRPAARERDDGVRVVGQRRSRASMTSPACIHDVVAVGAVYTRSFGSFTAPFVCRDDSTGADEIACFSNSSSELDLLAAAIGTLIGRPVPLLPTPPEVLPLVAPKLSAPTASTTPGRASSRCASRRRSHRCRRGRRS